MTAYTPSILNSRLFLTAIEQMPDMVMITDAEGMIQYVNPSFEQITGYTREQCIGQNAHILKSDVHPPEFYRDMWDTLMQGRVWKGTLQNRKADGSLYTEEESISPVRTPEGEVTHYVAVKRDVTAQLSLERQFRQSQKMEAIGTLAGGIAHDFNNLLTAIMGYTEMAQSELEAGTPMRKDLDVVMKAANRARDLVQQILSFSRKEEDSRSAVRFNLVVAEALRMLRSGLPPSVKLEERIDPYCGMVLANSAQLKQVLMNLCTNAYQALPRGQGRIVVELRHVDVDETMASAWPELHAGRHVLLSVEDNGQGIAPEHIERIFDPFFTTKNENVGTGMGLAMAYSCVRSHAGTIKVYSEIGRGTRFHIYLPVAPDLDSSDAMQRAMPGGNEQVLIVDDDDAVTLAISRQLERLGYRVIRCTQPADAMLVLRKQPHLFDVVLSDQTMPGIKGIELAAEVHKIRADLPVVLCSGLVTAIDETTMRDAHVAAFLPKPVETTVLAKTLRKVLDKK